VLISLSDEIPQGTELDYVMEALIHWKDAQYLEQLSRYTKHGLHLLARVTGTGDTTCAAPRTAKVGTPVRTAPFLPSTWKPLYRMLF